MLDRPKHDDRYARQSILPGVGPEGQERLKRARVLIVGLGGLGSPAALYLAGAGVGCLGLVDPDKVAISNLHRQILYGSGDHDALKTLVAARELGALNPEVELRAYPVRVTAANVERLVADYDLVLDGTDELEARRLIHDTCHRLAKPYVYGAVFQFEGQVSVFEPGKGPCLECLFPPSPTGEEPTAVTCGEAGTLGTVTGVIGCLQATEALKLILGVGRALHGRLLVYDALSAELRNLAFERRPDCALCGSTPALRQPTPLRAQSPHESTLEEFAARFPEALVVDLRAAVEREQGTLPGAQALGPDELDDAAEEWRSDLPILLYCQHGVRSLGAQHALHARGFSQVHHLSGGFEAHRRGRSRVRATP